MRKHKHIINGLEISASPNAIQMKTQFFIFELRTPLDDANRWDNATADRPMWDTRDAQM